MSRWNFIQTTLLLPVHTTYIYIVERTNRAEQHEWRRVWCLFFIFISFFTHMTKWIIYRYDIRMK